MIAADNVTLCCVDTAHHALSAVAMRRCNAAMRFGKTVFITDRDDHVDAGWEFHRIREFANYREFNLFMLKGLYDHIDTDYVLIVQFDGFLTNPQVWSHEFLQCDYIGAPWTWHPERYQVGNGGFSLRSRKLLRALNDHSIMVPTDGDPAATEDLWICHIYRSYLEVRHGIVFAPPEVAGRFSFESGTYFGPTFGFHGVQLMAGLFLGEDAKYLTDNLQPYMMRKAATALLATQYALFGNHDEAAYLFARIAQSQSYEQVLAKVRAEARSDFVGKFEAAWQRCLG